jgi:hypothetical protein
MYTNIYHKYDSESRYSQEFSFLHVVQTGSGAHPVGTGGSFPGGKAAGT